MQACCEHVLKVEKDGTRSHKLWPTGTFVYKELYLSVVYMPFFHK